MANLNVSSLMEAFALAAGIPPSVWRTVPDHTTATAQPEVRMKNVMLKDRIRILGVRHCMASTQEGNHDE
jgi:hypothetical protein